MPAEATRFNLSRTFRFISFAMSTANGMPGLFSVTSRKASSSEMGSMTSVYS